MPVPDVALSVAFDAGVNGRRCWYSLRTELPFDFALVGDAMFANSSQRVFVFVVADVDLPSVCFEWLPLKEDMTTESSFEGLYAAEVMSNFSRSHFITVSSLSKSDTNRFRSDSSRKYSSIAVAPSLRGETTPLLLDEPDSTLLDEPESTLLDEAERTLLGEPDGTSKPSHGGKPPVVFKRFTSGEA